MKNTILISVLTTLATNFLINSWLFWLIVFLGVWVYLGYLAALLDHTLWLEEHPTSKIEFPMFFTIGGPCMLFYSIAVNYKEALPFFWKHFFKKPAPKLRSPLDFE